MEFGANMRHCSRGSDRTGPGAGGGQQSMLADIIEVAQRSRLRSLFVALLLAIITGMIASTAIKHMGIVGKPAISDFDAFYMASRLLLRGDIVASYDYATYVKQQVELLGKNYRLTWSYPPPYNLVIAPLALVPRGWSFGLFFTVTASAYLWMMRRAAGANFVTMLVLLVLPICAVVLFGQNGLLTGTLVGLAVIGLRDRRGWAGIPLGLMIIKPHLAIALALYVVVDRRWQVFGVAALTVGVASLLPVLLLSPDIWTAFSAGIQNTASFLQGRFYPLCRMVSAYAALRSAGVPSAVALAGQALVAAVALAAIVVAQRRLPATTALGVAACLSLVMSPYAFDYDMPVIGAGLALLLPTLIERGGRWERSLVYALFLVVACYGAWHTIYYGSSLVGRTPAGALLVIMLVLVGRIVARIAPNSPPDGKPAMPAATIAAV